MNHKRCHHPSDSKIIKTVFLKNQELCEILRKTRLGCMAATTTEVNQFSLEGFEDATAGLESQFKVVSTRNFEGQQCYYTGDNVTVEIVSDPDGKAAAEIKIADKNDGTYAVSFIASVVGKHLVTVQINGDSISSQIYVKKRSFWPVKFIGVGRIDKKKLCNPWGVAVTNLNEMFVSDMNNNRIVVLNEEGRFIKSFGGGVVMNPHGLIIDNEGKTVVVSRNNNKIMHFSPNGEYFSTFNTAKSLNKPRGISLDSQGNIIVCDSGNKSVKSFSPDGRISRTIGLGSFQMPYDCLWHEDKIFVTDCDAHVIKVYNSHGGFLYEFGRFGTGDEELKSQLD